MKTKYTEEAKRLLLEYQQQINPEFNAANRPELCIKIAAALQAAAQEAGREWDTLHRSQIAEINKYKSLYETHKKTLIAAEAELAQLRAEVAKLTAEWDEYKKLYEHDHQLALEQASIVIEANTECNQLKAERDAAVVEGLKIAAKIFQYHRHRLRGVSADAFAICADMQDATAAEIAKRKEPA